VSSLDRAGALFYVVFRISVEAGRLGDIDFDAAETELIENLIGPPPLFAVNSVSFIFCFSTSFSLMS